MRHWHFLRRSLIKGRGWGLQKREGGGWEVVPLQRTGGGRGGGGRWRYSHPEGGGGHKKFLGGFNTGAKTSRSYFAQ